MKKNKAKQAVIEEKQKSEMYIENIFGKLIMKNLCQWEVNYNERNSSTPIVFELFPIIPVIPAQYSKGPFPYFGFFKLKLFVQNSNDRIVGVETNYDLGDFFNLEELPAYIADSNNKIIKRTDPISLLSECFSFLCDKINAIVQQVSEKIYMKTMINIWSSHLYGYKRFIESLRDIYSLKLSGVYVSTIAVKSDILERKEFYDNSESILYLSLSIIDTISMKIEVELHLECDQRFLFNILSYNTHDLYPELKQMKNFRPITDNIEKLISEKEKFILDDCVERVKEFMKL